MLTILLHKPMLFVCKFCEKIYLLVKEICADKADYEQVWSKSTYWFRSANKVCFYSSIRMVTLKIRSRSPKSNQMCIHPKKIGHNPLVRSRGRVHPRVRMAQLYSGIFLPFWSRALGLLNLGKKHLDHQNWEKPFQWNGGPKGWDFLV